MIKGTKIYKVKITGGKLDPKPYNQYEDFDSSVSGGDSLKTKYLEKAKALYRWYVLSMNFNKGLETLSNIKLTGGSASEVPSEVEFFLTYTQPDALWVRDEMGEVKVGTEALERIISETLDSEYNGFASQFNPCVYAGQTELVPTSSLPLGEKFKGIKVEAIDNAEIEVEEVREYKYFDEGRQFDESLPEIEDEE